MTPATTPPPGATLLSFDLNTAMVVCPDDVALDVENVA
jgi:hypothetical protein